MDEQLQNALVSQDVEFIQKHLNPSEGLQPPVIDCEALSNQLVKFQWHLERVIDLGKTRLTRLFLRGNESINIHDVDDGLRRAVYNFDVDHVRLLLQEFNADPNSLDRNLRTPISYLYSSGYKGRGIDHKAVEIMKMLIDRGAIIVNNVDGFNELQVTCILKYGSAEAVSIILDMDKIDLKEQYNPDICTVAHFLAQNRNPNILTQLQNRDFHVDSLDIYGCTPLWIAARVGVPQAVEFLLKEGADMNIGEELSPLSCAVFRFQQDKANHMECILLLLEHGADVLAQISKDNHIPTNTVFHVLWHLPVDERPSEVIMQHLALQVAIGTTVTELVQIVINSDADLKEQLSIGRKLLQSKIYGSHTLFSVLTCGDRKLVSLMRNEQLAEKLQSYLQSNSSIYYNRLLRKRMTKAGQMIELRGKAAFVVGKLMEMDHNCQFVVVDIVLSYLDLEDFNTLLSL